MVKYNNTGNFKWSELWGSGSTSCISNALVTDSTDNIYIAGRFGSKGCLLKYNYNNTLQWNITLVSELHDLAVDLQNNIYTIASSGYSQLSILKFNDDGILLWNKTYYIDDYLASSIVLDSSDNIYIGGSISLNSVPDFYDMFIMKCNNSGSFQSYIQFGTSYYENFRGITCDSLGNVYLLSESRNDDHIIILFKNPNNGLKLFQRSVNGYNIVLFCSVILVSIISIMILKINFKKS